MFELTYIHHDCFLLRTPELGVVFDFWYDPTCRKDDVPTFVKTFPKDRPLYVFVSHFHKDHFNKSIFQWSEQHPDIHYIISRDVAKRVRYLMNPNSLYNGKKVDSEKITVMSKSEHYSDSLLDVHCFGSTDVGNSYVLRIKQTNLLVFHAGDLNCWTWRDESTEEEIRAAEKAFRSELKSIREKFMEFDVVMFPVDSRIGTGFSEGAKIFLETFDVRRFFPMHFTLGESQQEIEQRRRDALSFEEYASGKGEFIGLSDPYDTYCDEQSSTFSKLNDKQSPQHTESWFLSAGDANAEMEMSLPLLTQRLIEISTDHANNLEIGNPWLPDHCGWVLSRVAIEMREYPIVSTTYSIDTWIETWNRHYSERAFCISDSEGRSMGYAREIWMVLDTHTHANAGLDQLSFSKEFLLSRECPIPRASKHNLLKLPEEIKENERRVVAAAPNPAEYTIQYTDLDAYRHVNTVRYVRLIMNQFTLKEHDEMIVRRVEFAFLDEGAYGMTIQILRSNVENTHTGNPERKVTEFLLRDKATLSPILFARVFMAPRDRIIPRP